MAADRLHSEIEEAANDRPASYRRGEIEDVQERHAGLVGDLPWHKNRPASIHWGQWRGRATGLLLTIRRTQSLLMQEEC